MNNNLLNLFGLGKMKFSASVASFIALLIFILVQRLFILNYEINLVLFFIFLAVTIALVDKNKEHLTKDPKEVVIDEFLGAYVCLLIVNSTLLVVNVGLFVLFRALDLIKPWPFYYLDRVDNKWGFLLDDLFIGIVVGVIIYLIQIIL